jgi:hypothetical protein
LDDRLQAFRIQAADAAEETIDKTGFSSGHNLFLYLANQPRAMRHFGTQLRSNLLGDATSKRGGPRRGAHLTF